MHRSHLLAPLLVSAALLACGPAPEDGTPSATRPLSVPDTVSLTPGGTVEVSVSLSADAATGPTRLLSVEGLPEGVRASFAPDRVSKQTPTGTLHLDASADAARGTSLVRVRATGEDPDAPVLESAFALTVRGLRVSGRVAARGGAPREATSVHIGASVASVGPDGTFTIDDVRVPYDLVIRQERALLLVPGLTTATPSIATPWRSRTPTARSSAIRGAVSGTASDDETLLVCFDAPGVTSCTEVYAGQTDYRLYVDWEGPSRLEGVLRAMKFSSYAPVHTFTGAFEVAVTAVDWRSEAGGDVIQDVALGAPPPLRTIPVTVTSPTATSSRLDVSPLVRFGPELTIRLGGVSVPGGPQAEAHLEVPASAPAPLVVASYRWVPPFDEALAWTFAEASGATIAFAPAPVILGPAHGAALGATTELSLSVEGAAAIRHLFLLADGREVLVQTAAPAIRFPDLSAHWPDVSPADVRSWSVSVAPGASTFEASLGGEPVFELDRWSDALAPEDLPTRDGQLFRYAPVELNR